MDAREFSSRFPYHHLSSSYRTRKLWKITRLVSNLRSAASPNCGECRKLVQWHQLGKRCLIARAVVKLSHPVLISLLISLDVAQRSSSPRPTHPFIIPPSRSTREVSLSHPLCQLLHHLRSLRNNFRDLQVVQGLLKSTISRCRCSSIHWVTQL